METDDKQEDLDKSENTIAEAFDDLTIKMLLLTVTRLLAVQSY